MAINNLIAQGIAPIGRDLPDVANMLAHRRMQEQQNAIATQNAEQYRRSLDMQSQAREQEMAQRKAAEARGWIEANYDAIKARPDAMPKLLALAKQKQYLPPDFPDNATLEDVALHFGVQAPAAPVPFEQTPDGLKFNEQRRQFDERMKLDRAKFAADQRAGAAATAPQPPGAAAPPAAPQKPLPVVLEKRLIDVNEAGYGARASATRYEGIAAEMERVLPTAGVRAKWTEALKEVTGSEDAVTELRKNYSAVRFSAAVKNLPPGPATDRDIQLALGGFLPENANPQAIASFLRGLAKMEAIKADYHEFEAAYIAENRSVAGFAKAWQEHAAKAYPKGEAQPAQNGDGVVTVSTPQEAMALPRGTKFKTPDGRIKVR